MKQHRSEIKELSESRSSSDQQIFDTKLWKLDFFVWKLADVELKGIQKDLNEAAMFSLRREQTIRAEEQQFREADFG